MKKPAGFTVKSVTIASILILALIQFIPFDKAQSNPPVIREPVWISPSTRSLAKRACFDCHSNETVWPWYSRVAPVSWLIQMEVSNGRKALNFSEWEDGARKGENPKVILEELGIEGEMPPIQYTLIHNKARLTSKAQHEFAIDLAATAMNVRR
jgi:hypothetical protein